MTPSTRWFVLIVAVAAVILCACGSSARAKQQVLIEPIETATPQSLAAAAAATPRPAPTEATGGKPAAPLLRRAHCSNARPSDPSRYISITTGWT